MCILTTFPHGDYGDLIPSSKVTLTKEIIIKAKDGDRDSTILVIKGFFPLILNELKHYPFVDGHDKYDLVQVGLVSVLGALKKFDINYFNYFNLYVASAVKKNYASICKKNNSNKVCLSLNQEASLDNKSELIDLLIDRDSNIEDTYITNSFLEALDSAISYLSCEEKHLFSYLTTTNDKCPLKSYSEKYKLSYNTCRYRKNKLVLHLKNLLKSFL